MVNMIITKCDSDATQVMFTVDLCANDGKGTGTMLYAATRGGRCEFK